ncbi:GNAT family N-acetyltransferase [Pengzhenrongella frigida]|uniref:N-acetyltransferase n=1 Tax=Pengzhenrongella frigida TaxID=1259133 RepID=A0A4Q5N5M9_9MICO|nr:GNAT family protein [Cellulomonas sp. HLT2-17]RYV52853.1 N-acetyltransferase [Cellulomonas sp. HLT2-17]
MPDDPTPPTPAGPPPAIELRVLSALALRALYRLDLATASDLVGARMPEFFTTEGWLWRWRLHQIEADPDSAHWYVRAAVAVAPDDAAAPSLVVGHAGFHGPPDAGTIEIGYTVVPALRGRGYGHGIVAALLAEAAREANVRIVRASISPTNAASLALVQRAGFVQVGEQWDDEDGLELVFERPVVLVE